MFMTTGRESIQTLKPLLSSLVNYQELLRTRPTVPFEAFSLSPDYFSVKSKVPSAENFSKRYERAQETQKVEIWCGSIKKIKMPKIVDDSDEIKALLLKKPSATKYKRFALNTATPKVYKFLKKLNPKC